jgi:hypothetical protein
VFEAKRRAGLAQTFWRFRVLGSGTNNSLHPAHRRRLCFGSIALNRHFVCLQRSRITDIATKLARR